MDIVCVFNELSKRKEDYKKYRTVIAAAQYVFDPCTENEIIITPQNQYEKGELCLGKENALRINVNTLDFEILGLHGNTLKYKEGILFKQFLVQESQAFHSCVIQPYQNGEVTQDIRRWIALPKIRPQINQEILIEFDRDTMQTYYLNFDILPDEAGIVAYFGKCYN